MSYTLCKKLQELTPYAPIEGDYRLRLDANESYFGAEDFVPSFGEALAQIEFNRYPDSYAVEVCRAFSDFYDLPEALVTAGNGSDELISVICSCFLEKGQKLLTFSPDFSMYQFYGALYELETPILPKKGMELDVDGAIAFIRENHVDAVIFSNPCNPTSLGLSREEVRRLVSSVEALVVLDEAYMDFWDQSLLPEVQNFDNLIILKTCSKAVGMAALRLGFAVAKPQLSIALRAAKSPYNVNSVTQALGARVLRQKGYLQQCRDALVENAQSLYGGLAALAEEFPLLGKVYPTCTNFVFVSCPKAREIQEKLAERSIAVRCFPGALRITTADPAGNRELLAAIRDILVEIKEGV